MNVTLTHPPIVKPVTVELTRKWSDWDAGDRITTDSEKAKRMIAKGYGVEVQSPKLAEQAKIEPPVPQKRPEVETAMADPAPETAEATPKRARRAGNAKGGD